MKNAVNVLEYLEASALRWPEKSAFTDGQDDYTFSRLMRTARVIGTGLSGYVGPSRGVAVCMEKSAAQIAAFFGAVYAGAFYCPVDVDQPARRMQAMLDTLRPAAVVADRAGAEKLGKLSLAGPVLLFDELERAEEDGEKLAAIRRQAIDSDPLYVMFTSGSAGAPKGVAVSHRSVIDLTEWFCGAFGFTEEDVFGSQTPFYFDASVKEIYAALKTGAAMRIIPRELFSFPLRLIEYINEQRVSCIMWVPSVLCRVAEFDTFETVRPRTLRTVLFSGEVMPVKQFNVWRRALPGVRFANLYGPTEAAVDAAYYIVDREFRDGEPIPIGRACENTDVFLLNERDERAAPGETGEICIRGTSLALGYLRDPAATAAAFVQNPLHDRYPERIYRTGDLGRYNERGELIYLGRKDRQIKHMGHRIEPGEIEATAEAVSGVRRACCLYDGRRSRILCLYEGTAPAPVLRAALQEALPRYMLPGEYHAVAALPVNANGKIDRRALAERFMQG